MEVWFNDISDVSEIENNFQDFQINPENYNENNEYEDKEPFQETGDVFDIDYNLHIIEWIHEFIMDCNFVFTRIDMYTNVIYNNIITRLKEITHKYFEIKEDIDYHSLHYLYNPEDFFDEIRKIAKYDCDAFSKKWLENRGFDYDYVIQLLSKNKSLKSLLDIKRRKGIPFNENRELFEKIMVSDAYFPIKEEIIYQCEKVPFEDKKSLLKLALATKEVKVRQAIANTTPKVSPEFKSDFESLLNDNSYITKEISLSTFWSQFPDDQKRILDISKEWIGFNDKNLRILWLTLALGTKEFQMDNKAEFYDELLSYCNPEFETSIRQNAIENLLFINNKDQNVLPNLVNAMTSHKWQFSKFGKDKIRLLLKNPNIRNYLEQLIPNLSKEDSLMLGKIVSENSAK